nr:hypothetical protein [Fodinibius sp.]
KNVIIVQETALNRSKDQDEAPSLTTPKPKEQPTPSDDEIAEDKTTPAPSAEEEQSQQQAEESSFPWIWVIAGGLIVTGVLGLVFYSRRRKRLQGEKRNKDLEPVHKTMKPQRRDQEVSSAQRQAHEGNGKKKEKEKREPAHADY